MTGPRKIKFLDPAEIEEAIGEIAALAHSHDADVALVGGAAMAAYGSDRLTRDVDFASDLIIPGLPVLRKLPFGGIATKISGDVPVDLIVRDDEYADLYAEALHHTVDVGLPVKVVTAEYLAALKMAAGRSKDEADLETLVALGAADLPKTRKIVKTHLGEYAARSLDHLVEEIAWKRSKEGQ